MKTLRNALVAARAIGALAVAYAFIHAGAGALSHFAIAWNGQGALDKETVVVGAVGALEIAASFALFESRSAPRMVAAVLLLWSHLASVTGATPGAVAEWCVVTTLVLAFVP